MAVARTVAWLAEAKRAWAAQLVGMARGLGRPVRALVPREEPRESLAAVSPAWQRPEERRTPREQQALRAELST